MSGGGIPIGRLFGISLRLHYSWFFIFALITWALTAQYFPTTYPTWSLAMKIGAGLVTSILFFGSVLLHEIYHSLVALHQGLQIKSITLFFLGGVSEISGEPKTAGDEFRMAGVGPGSSLVLGGIFLGIFFALRGTNTLPAQFGAAVTFYLGYINLALGVFNLIPGFPLDGGRVLRSIIWWRTQNLQNATRIASTVGRGIGFLFIFGGIYLVFTGNFFNGIWLALIGWFLESAAVGSYRQLLLQDMLKRHIAADIMTRECVTVSPDITVEKLANENIIAGKQRCFPVAEGDHLEGLVTLDNVRKIPREKWSTTDVGKIMVTLDHLKSVNPNDDLYSVFKLMTESDINQVPVVYNNDIVGMIGRDNLLNYINNQMVTRARS
jgi:Zn-dependent protease/predicted transcriptional regulator